MRLVLKPALARLWRDPGTLQLGLDPPHAVLLGGLDPPRAQLLAALDGSADLETVRSTAGRHGVPAAEATRVLRLLSAAGALDDADSLRDAGRGPLQPDAASLSLLSPLPGHAARVLAGRAAARVRVVGAGRVGAQLALLLAAAGIGAIDVDDDAPVGETDLAPGGLVSRRAGSRAQALAERLARWCSSRRPGAAGPDAAASDTEPTLVVLAPVHPDPAAASAALRSGVPHLYAAVRETTATIGPLVLPGRSACLRCLDLARADRDPGWPGIAAQLAQPSRHAVAACDGPLAALAAAVGAMQALATVDALTLGTSLTEHPCVDGTLELRLPDWRLRRRTRQPHPACGCIWPAA